MTKSATSTRKTPSRTAQKTKGVTRLQSLNVIRNMIRVSISEICYLRDLFPESLFKERVYADMHIKCLAPENVETKDASDAIQVTQWLEEGVFAALDKAYLKSLMFCVYSASPTNQPGNMLESYTYNFHYTEHGDTKLSASFMASAEGTCSPDQVKSQAIQMIRSLVSITNNLDPLPPNRVITMKLRFHDRCPTDWQPPFFCDAPWDDDCDFEAASVKLDVGKLRTPHHIVTMEIEAVDNSFETMSQHESRVPTTVASSRTSCEIQKGSPRQDSEPSKGQPQLLSTDQQTSSQHDQVISTQPTEEELLQFLVQSKTVDKQILSDQFPALTPRKASLVITKLLKHQVLVPSKDPKVFGVGAYDDALFNRAITECHGRLKRHTTPQGLSRALSVSLQVAKSILYRMERENFVESGSTAPFSGYKIVFSESNRSLIHQAIKTTKELEIAMTDVPIVSPTQVIDVYDFDCDVKPMRLSQKVPSNQESPDSSSSRFCSAALPIVQAHKALKRRKLLIKKIDLATGDTDRPGEVRGMVKFWLYSSASLVACGCLLWYTYMTRQQFYPAVIYLVTSKISVLILGNAGLVVTMLLGRLVKSIFLGALRDAEVEILHENVRYAITETCLALTIFRDEINFQVVVLFTSLVFLKIFHWLSQSRIEFIEQTDVVSRLTHMRLVALMSILAAVDMAFVLICGMKVVETGPSVFILFGFEFLILFVTLTAIFLRYVLHLIDARMDGNWASKFTYLFYLELVSEIIKLLIYLVFFMLIFTYYGMPLHIVRDLWVSIKNLQRRIASYFRYRKITANLNERFPNPTEEELQETDRTCIICREEMSAALSKKLPCSHIFHIDCLKMWVQRQQTCPTCRSIIPTSSRPPVAPTAPGAAPARPAAGQPPHGPPPGPAQNVQPPAPAQVNPAPPAQATNPAMAQQPQASTPHLNAPHIAGAQGTPPPVGYPPYMSPYLFGPAFGAPFGFGMPPGYGVMPPFGFHPAAPGSGSTHPIPDPAILQRQIELLHAQLAALQAATHAFSGSTQSHQQAYPASAHPSPVPQPSSAAPEEHLSTEEPATASPPPTASNSRPSFTEQSNVSPSQPTDDLEDKPPVPVKSSATATHEEESRDSSATTAPVDVEIPRVLSEAEQRREELRRRYNRIYGDAPTSTETKNEAKDE